MRLSINTRNCTVWCPPGATSRLTVAADQLERAPTPIVLGQFLEPALLYFEAGPESDSQLDPDDSTCESLLEKRRGFISRLFDLTRQGLSKQAARCLLRLFAASDTTWTARTMGSLPPLRPTLTTFSSKLSIASTTGPTSAPTWRKGPSCLLLRGPRVRLQHRYASRCDCFVLGAVPPRRSQCDRTCRPFGARVLREAPWACPQPYSRAT